jgi:hypothetical protein
VLLDEAHAGVDEEGDAREDLGHPGLPDARRTASSTAIAVAMA